MPCGRTAVNRQKIATYQKQRDERTKIAHSKLRPSSAALVDRRNEIVSMRLEDLRKALQSEVLSAVDALDAYMWKAIQVNEEINCVAEFLNESFDYAKDLDAVWKGVKNKPPLFGVPFSVKSNFYMEGYDCCMGLGKFLFKPMTEECTLVKHLRSLGAVPFVLTNVPQALLSFECSNSVYGTTGNPFDTKRTPGGSSGGECALVSRRGCAFGTGSDLAGSLRIPAHMCGVFSLKSTEARLCVDYAAGMDGKGRLAISYGFFTFSVDEQIFLYQLVFGSESYRAMVPRTAPIPMNMERIAKISAKKLRIGYFLDDGFLKPVPACANVVKETTEKLQKAGHEIVEFALPKPYMAAALFFKNLMPDAGEHVRSLYDKDVVSPYMKTVVTLLGLPKSLRRFGSVAMKSSSPQMSIVAGSFNAKVSDIFHTDELTDQYILEFTNNFQSLKLDAIVCPAFTVPAVPHEFPSDLAACALSTGLYNMLNYPAGIVPIREVLPSDDEQLENEKVWPVGSNPLLKTMRNAAKKSKGLPLAVQVVTLPFQEEECLAVMRVIERLSKQ